MVSGDIRRVKVAPLPRDRRAHGAAVALAASLAASLAGAPVGGCAHGTRPAAHVDRAPATPAEAQAGTPAGPASSAERPPAPPASLDAEPPPTDELVPLAVPTPIEDASGVALRAFHAALRRAEAGEGQARIIFHGASHVASDMYTDVIRRRLQQRFGDAGPGFVLPAKAWRWYTHTGVSVERSAGFTALRVKAKRPRDDAYGLLGVAFDASARKTARAAVRTVTEGEQRPQANVIEIAYLVQPGGGTLDVVIDGRLARSLETGAPARAGAHARFDVTEGAHHVALRTRKDGPVRVFGVVFEREAPGVVLDTLGVPGARARDQLHWDDAVYRDALRWRRPDLVVLAYGTNESGDDAPIAEEEARVRAVVARVREATPAASCLLVGPSDRPVRLPDGTYEPRARTDELVAMQRRIALDQGCGFFDVMAFMGGPLSMLRWAAAPEPLGGRDLVHFSRRGYAKLGEVLHDALLAGYGSQAPLVGAAPGATQPRTAPPALPESAGGAAATAPPGVE